MLVVATLGDVFAEALHNPTGLILQRHDLLIKCLQLFLLIKARRGRHGHIFLSSVQPVHHIMRLWLRKLILIDLICSIYLWLQQTGVGVLMNFTLTKTIRYRLLALLFNGSIDVSFLCCS